MFFSFILSSLLFFKGKKKSHHERSRDILMSLRGATQVIIKSWFQGNSPTPPPPYNKSLALKGSPDNGSDAKPREVPRGNSKTPGPPAGGGCQGARCCSFKNIFRCLASAVAGCCLGERETGRRSGQGWASQAGSSTRVYGMESASNHGAVHLALLNHSQHMVRDICPGFGPHRLEETGLTQTV